MLHEEELDGLADELMGEFAKAPTSIPNLLALGLSMGITYSVRRGTGRYDKPLSADGMVNATLRTWSVMTGVTADTVREAIRMVEEATDGES